MIHQFVGQPAGWAAEGGTEVRPVLRGRERCWPQPGAGSQGHQLLQGKKDKYTGVRQETDPQFPRCEQPW